MAIFPHLDLEPVVQVFDRTRLDATKSFVTPDATITLLEIKPITGASFVDVTEDKYLDWQYGFAGSVTVTCRVTTSASASAEFSETISVVTPALDNLFSTDSDLKLHEPDIMKWTEDGRNSFNNIHRRAKKLMLEYLRREGYVDVFGVPYTENAIKDIEEVRQWVTFIALRIIFEGISNSTEDVFNQKAKRYSEMEIKWRSIALLRLDTDGDGELTEGEGIDTRSCFVARR
jgi:hypothetical protein